MTRMEIVREAERWVGTPWAHQGRTRKGCDCLGFLVGVATKFNVKVLDRSDYGRLPNDYSLLNGLDAHCKRTKKDGKGNIVIFRFLRFPQHVGIDCGDYFIHAYEGVRKVAYCYWDDRWYERTLGLPTFLMPGVED